MLSRLGRLTTKLQEKVQIAMARSAAEAKFIEVINDDAWGPTGPQMDELMEMYGSNTSSGDDILMLIRQSLDNRDAAARRCYKTLLLMDHLIRNIDDRFVDDFRAFSPTLVDIAHTYRVVKSSGHGSPPPPSPAEDHEAVSIRERAKKIHELLLNDDTLRDAREKALVARQRTSGISDSGNGSNRFRGFSEHDARDVGGLRHNHHHVIDRRALPVAGDKVAPGTIDRDKQFDADHEMALKMQREEEARAKQARQLQEEADFRLALQVQQGMVSSPVTAHSHPSARQTPPSTVHAVQHHGVTAHGLVAATHTHSQPARANDGFGDFVPARGPVPHHPSAATDPTPVAQSTPLPKTSLIDDLYGGPAPTSALPTAWHPPATATAPPTAPPPLAPRRDTAEFDPFFSAPVPPPGAAAVARASDPAASRTVPGVSASAADPAGIFDDFVASRVTVSAAAASTSGTQNSSGVPSGRAW